MQRLKSIAKKSPAFSCKAFGVGDTGLDIHVYQKPGAHQKPFSLRSNVLFLFPSLVQHFVEHVVKQKKPCTFVQDFWCGRYWIRTSDPLLVRQVL